MANYFRNLKQTLHSIDPAHLSGYERFKMWLSERLRVMWTLIFMLVLCVLSLWIALKVGERTGTQTPVEILVPEMNRLSKPEENLKQKVGEEQPAVERPTSRR